MIEVAIFFANAAILALEIVGGRSLTPYFGSSAEVWAGILAVVLAGLAIGYRAGGIFADRAKNEQRLRTLLAITLGGAGIAIATTWMVADAFAIVGTALAQSAGLTVGAAMVALFLLFPASILLAAVSPIAAKIRIRSLADSASVVGRLSAIAAIGSVAGSLITGIVLIPNVGSKESIIGIGISLIVLAIPFSTKGKRVTMSTLFVFFIGALISTHLVFASSAAGAVVGTLVADIDTRYNRMWIIDAPHRDGETYLRLVRTDPNSTQCGALMKGNAPTDADEMPIFQYTKAFDAVFRVIPEPEHILIIGGCNYSYPRHTARIAPKATIDVVELDPGMTAMAERWFGFVRPPTMNIFHADGRTFLNEAGDGKKPYDIVFIDAYNSILSIPYQLMTQEAFEKLRHSLAPGGIVVFNIIGTFEGKGSPYLGSVLSTLRTSFTHVEVFRIKDVPLSATQNIIVMASADEVGRELLTHAIGESGVLTLTQYPVTLRQMSNEKINFDEALVLTDNYAPVEALTKPLRERRY